MPPETCPNCGAVVPPQARACPGCGSDESTGWSDSATASHLGIPEEKFDYEDFVQEEFAHRPLKPRGIHWRSSGLEEPGREERTKITLPPEIELVKVADRSLSDMLEAGEIDALFSARAPSCFERGAAHVTRLFPDYRAAEEARKQGPVSRA